MRKLNQKFGKIGIISSVICSFIFFSCEKSEDITEKNNVNYSSELRKESLNKRNGLVSYDVALDVAIKFNPLVFFKQDNETNYSKKISSLDGNNKIKNKTIIKDSNNIPAFYIFNYEDNQGFIFVSADYKMQPILAFFENGEYKKDIVPSGLLQWVDKTIENIEILRKGSYDNSNDANYAWDNYYNHNSKLAPPPTDPCDKPNTSYVVGPLLNVTWGQGYSYNELCPNLSCTNNNLYAWTGCVATATAQVIKYWQPTNQYNYNYTTMPTNQGNADVRRLMRDFGNNVGMNYGCSGSGASETSVAPALKANFGFSSANHGGYNYQKIKNNINNLSPVLLSGCRTSSGNWFIINWGNSYSNCHEWVCDGTNTYNYTICENGQWQGGGSYLFFHMNWGWHEVGTQNDYNGWFLYNNWNINGLNHNYEYSNSITSEIHP